MGPWTPVAALDEGGRAVSGWSQRYISDSSLSSLSSVNSAAWGDPQLCLSVQQRVVNGRRQPGLVGSIANLSRRLACEPLSDCLWLWAVDGCWGGPL